MLEVRLLTECQQHHINNHLGSKFDTEVKYNTITEKKIDYLRTFVPGL